MRFFRSLPPTPAVYRNEKVLADLMLGEHAIGFVGGAGSCSGCGEATALRMLVAATLQVHGPQAMGIVAATGCNTVYGSTYPFNPWLIPWTNSLFENAPADAMGIRTRWDQAGHADRRLWVVGGDGAMYDIGFQSLSRMVASGADIKVLVLDTQAYSNTGGQASTATFGGQVTKLSAYGKELHGRPERRKELGRILLAHGDVFVAQTTPAHINHFYRAVMDANSYPGPAVLVVYTPCQPEHGIADDASNRQARLAVDSRAFPLFTYDPRRGESHRRAAVGDRQPGRQGGLVDAAGRQPGRLPGLCPHRGPLCSPLRQGRPADPGAAGDAGRPAGQLAHAAGAGGHPMSTPAPQPTRRERRAAERAAHKHPQQGAGASMWRSPVVLMTLAAALVGLVVIGVIAFSAMNGGAGDTSMRTPPAALPSGIVRDGRSLGQAAAPVAIDVYEDPQCPVCGRWTRDLEPLLVASYVRDGTVRLTYHDYVFIGPESLDAAVGMRVADQLGGQVLGLPRPGVREPER